MLFLDLTVIDNRPIKELAEISIRLVKLRQLNQQVSNVKGEIITAKRKKCNLVDDEWHNRRLTPSASR